jgi:hypothetical protein
VGACRKNGTLRSRFKLGENGGSHSPEAAPRAAARSSPIYGASSDEKGFESPQVVSPITDVTAFLAGLRFETRNLLDELPLDLVI